MSAAMPSLADHPWTALTDFLQVRQDLTGCTALFKGKTEKAYFYRIYMINSAASKKTLNFRRLFFNVFVLRI